MATATRTRKLTPAQQAKAEKTAARKAEVAEQIKTFEYDEFDIVSRPYFAKYHGQNPGLIFMQDEEATDVATFKGWQERGRSVAKGAGEHTIWIRQYLGKAEAKPATATEPATEERDLFRWMAVWDIRHTTES
jgi:hypothetical protein